MADYPWLLALRYGTPLTSFVSTISMAPWKYQRRKEGGSITAGSGVMAAYTIRTDRVLVLAPRIRETEWESFAAGIDYGVERPGSLSISLNGSTGPFVPVYVVSPKHGEDWEPARDGQLGSVLLPSVAVRRVDGLAWTADYYGGA